MGSLLRNVSNIRWTELSDATGTAAGGIPPLLSRIAYGDEDTARIGIDDLGDAICALGFIIAEATAPTVPFLLELAGSSHVTCTAELLDLLGKICRTDQWHCAAAASRDRGHDATYRQQTGWETAARTALQAGRPVIEDIASSAQPEHATPARKLLKDIKRDRPGLPK